MQVDPCGCVWEDGDGAWCPKHRAQRAKTEEMAWRISAKRGCTFDEAWNLIWERIIAISIIRIMRKAGAELVKA